jgi:TRAP-type mannitol/chloroaromatic compound transport system permease small subunit
VLADADLGPAGGIAFGFVLIVVGIAWPRFAQSWMRTAPNGDGNRIIDRHWWHFTQVRLGQLMLLLSGVVLVILDIITILR